MQLEIREGLVIPRQRTGVGYFVKESLQSQIDNSKMHTLSFFQQWRIQMDAVVLLDADSLGLAFQGIGGVTSNGMTKLLYEYPARQREEILDLLFKPFHGASLHALKVEIGSDANGTCGTEPSHMRSEDDLDITRGVGLQMALDARRRNPSITLDAIRWGTPAWIADYQGKYRYYLEFLRGAREHYGLEFDYICPDENEGGFDVNWIVNVLRPCLDRDGFASVKLIGADSTEDWNIVPLVQGNEDLRACLGALSRHYQEDSPQEAKDLGLSILDSEDIAPYRNSFFFALDMARRIIRSYASGRMVMYVMHPVIEAIYDNLPYTCKSILLASSPWDGCYHVQPGLWVTAHFTQFIQPGWRYIDSACCSGPDVSALALQDPASKLISIILLNQSDEPVNYSIQLMGLDAGASLHCWMTCEKFHFQKQPDVKIDSNKASVCLPGMCICTLTNSEGQGKGDFCEGEEKGFKLPYSDDFQGYEAGRQPRLTVDQAGAFEAAEAEDGKCLMQVLTKKQIPVDWTRRPTPQPYTVLGPQTLMNHRVSIDFKLDGESSYAALGARCTYASAECSIPDCYMLRIDGFGRWLLLCGPIVLRAGHIKDFDDSSWHRCQVSCCLDRIEAFCDGAMLGWAADKSLSSGNLVLGSSYDHVCFRNLRAEAIEGVPAFCSRYSVLDNKVRLDGTWKSIGNDAVNYSRTLMQGSQGSRMSFRFQGSLVCLIGTADSASGKAEVFIDSRPAGVLEGCSASKGVRRKLFMASGLGDGSHDCLVRVLGNVSLSAIETCGPLTGDCE
jgi:galactosylceramidase